MTGMSDRVCVDLCSLMKPGILSPSVLVGSFARGLFLVHSQSNYIATRPFAVNTSRPCLYGDFRRTFSRRNLSSSGMRGSSGSYLCCRR
ncbi:putative 3-dehydroquinate synthase II [Helianthus annuus]|uniref:3-dehydroquinate synthase II n=1 Tax=Helianthus annuus TaxID=4232 RepID=A0A9K3IL11_HELAN|nr:putative 3-dehydroquinate synthase II [Helianthus annuus]